MRLEDSCAVHFLQTTTRYHLCICEQSDYVDKSYLFSFRVPQLFSTNHSSRYFPINFCRYGALLVFQKSGLASEKIFGNREKENFKNIQLVVKVMEENAFKEIQLCFHLLDLALHLLVLLLQSFHFRLPHTCRVPNRVQ
jgi:hypothetical protein